ncbi:MAG: 16S rRNA (cytosine(1402)-N(4))-methyltransferase RsmH [Flavobacteriales bacterium]|nr:16S rRNA (cytosine(1402)-N(4))-methyltransferase RsmH [Flavobacteriales bacterium]
MNYHDPVLLQECIGGLKIDPEGIYVDLTFGGGGHSREIIKQLKGGHLFAFDQDKDAQMNLLQENNFTFIPHNFRYVKNFLRLHNALPVSGILADLGISSYQIDEASRGFSIRNDGPLDMRMSEGIELTAKQIINTYSQEELSRIFRNNADLKEAWKMAKTIVAARTSETINTISEFKNVVLKVAPRGKENSFLARVFQAIRIEVNDEINALHQMLAQMPNILSEGGRLVVISYHSLEDRPVKNLIRSGNIEGEIAKDFYGKPLVPFHAITRKPIIPSDEEIARNPRARSAKLRIAEKM